MKGPGFDPQPCIRASVCVCVYVHGVYYACVYAYVCALCVYLCACVYVFHFLGKEGTESERL